MADLLKEKVAIVTGSGRGIGRGVAELMAAQGAKVVVVDPGVNVDGTGEDSSFAQQVVDEIKAGGGEAVASLESVATMAGGEKIVQTALDAFGKVRLHRPRHVAQRVRRCDEEHRFGAVERFGQIRCRMQGRGQVDTGKVLGVLPCFSHRLRKALSASP